MTFLVSSIGHDWGLMNCPLLTLTWNPLETYSSIKWAKIKVGVVMTFVWMNYGRMVGDSTLQTVNTTGLILQVGTLSRTRHCFAVYLCQWIIAGHICLLVLLHHIAQASGREEDLLNHPPSLHHWHVHHHCWGKTCNIPHIQWVNQTVSEGPWGNYAEHWLAWSNNVICLLLGPSGQYSRGSLSCRLSLVPLFVLACLSLYS